MAPTKKQVTRQGRDLGVYNSTSTGHQVGDGISKPAAYHKARAAKLQAQFSGKGAGGGAGGQVTLLRYFGGAKAAAPAGGAEKAQVGRASVGSKGNIGGRDITGSFVTTICSTMDPTERSEDSKDLKESKDFRDSKDSKDLKISKDFKDSKALKEEPKESKDSKVSTDSKYEKKALATPTTIDDNIATSASIKASAAAIKAAKTSKSTPNKAKVLEPPTSAAPTCPTTPTATQPTSTPPASTSPAVPPSTQTQPTATPTKLTLTKPPTPPQIFATLTLHISGTTTPYISDHSLRCLLCAHGARISAAIAQRTTTHVLVGGGVTGGTLAAGKLQKEVKRRRACVKFVGIKWALDSIKAGRRLPESRYAPGARAAGQKGVGEVFKAVAEK